MFQTFYSLDLSIFHFINQWAGKNSLADALGVFAAVFLLPFLFFLLFLAAFSLKKLAEEHWWELMIKILIAAGLAYVIRSFLGEVFFRLRPFAFLNDVGQLITMSPSESSFPSGHAAVSFAVAFFIIFNDRSWGWAFIIIAGLISVGRIFVGVHYPSDIVGGFLVGLVAAWVVRTIERGEWGKVKRRLKS